MSEDSENCMHIGCLAREAGTTTRTVRYYEEMGLLQPERRSKGGFRCYSKDQLTQLRMILSLKELEFDLEHIRCILDRRPNSETGGELASDILNDLRERVEEVNHRVDHYARLQEKLALAVDSLCRCLPCECREKERLCSDCDVLRQETEEPLPFFHQIQVN
jgi:DNA-binding transcriptional MerR regulator